MSLLVPYGLQLREHPTLGDVLALPIARRDLVRLRYLEALGAGLMALAVVFGVGLFGHWMQVGGGMGPRLQGLDLGRGPGVVTPALLAYPRPLYRRWGWKGLGVAWGVPDAVIVLGSLVVMLGGKAFMDRLVHLLLVPFQWLGGHPGPTALGMLLLLVVSYALSLRAIEYLEA